MQLNHKYSTKNMGLTKLVVVKIIKFKSVNCNSTNVPQLLKLFYQDSKSKPALKKKNTTFTK